MRSNNNNNNNNPICNAPGANTDPEARKDATQHHSSGWSLKATLNRCLLSLDLKVACDGLDCTSLGSEFHTVGDTKQKDRLAKSDVT